MNVAAQLYDGTNSVVVHYQPGLETEVLRNMRRYSQSPQSAHPLVNTFVEIVTGEGQARKESHVALEFVRGTSRDSGEPITFYGMMEGFQTCDYSRGYKMTIGPHEGSHLQFMKEALPVALELLAQDDSRLAEASARKLSERTSQKVTTGEILPFIQESRTVISGIVRYIQNTFDHLT